jgi:hypothetical protein
MCHVNSDESVPEALECVQLKPGLDTQHKSVLLQLRIRGRLISLVFVEHKCIVISKSVDQKPHRYHILFVQAYTLMFHRVAQLADISRHDEVVPAAVGCGIMNNVYLQANQRGTGNKFQLHTISL